MEQFDPDVARPRRPLFPEYNNPPDRAAPLGS